MSYKNKLFAIKDCEVCSSNITGPKLDFGMQPLCDDLNEDVNYSLNATKYRQKIILCLSCLTAHQKYQVPKNNLFKSNYHYRASLTKDVLNGMKELANSASKFIKLDQNSVVLDIGCNDGSLLKIFKELYNCQIIGVDPTDAIDFSENLDLKLKDYFDIKAVEEIKKKFDKVDLITFTNVFAHIEDLNLLLKNLSELIDLKTVIIIENHYLGSIVDKSQFDTFYHEHPRTYSIESFKHISKKLDMNLVDVSFPKRYGGNIRVVLAKDNAQIDLKLYKEKRFVEKFETMQSIYENWADKSKEVIDIHQRSNKIFFGKSLPGRAVMLINSLELKSSIMPTVFEQSFSPKVNNFIPGTDIKVDSDDNIKNGDLIIWSWHIFDEVLLYLKNLNYVGNIWTPLPHLRKVAKLD